MTTARDHTNHLAELLRRERHAMADFLLALATFDGLRLWEELGHASLFSFLRRELGLSAGAAQYRKTAAELVRRFPEVEAALRAGTLCLSSVVELSKVLTAENLADVLPRFHGLSSRDAAAVAVSIRPVPRPPVREVLVPLAPAARVTHVPGSDRADSESVRAHELASGQGTPPAADGVSSGSFRAHETTLTPVTPAAPPTRPAVEPLDACHARLHLTVSRRLLAKLEAARAELSHVRPGATSEEVLEAALDALLALRAKRKGRVEKPRAARPASPDTVTAAAKREVWARSGGTCEFPLESGGTCGSTLRLEIDHVTPRALGGPSTVDNLRIACRAHNQLAARRAFGEAWMERFRAPAEPAISRAPSASPGTRRGAPDAPPPPRW